MKDFFNKEAFVDDVMEHVAGKYANEVNPCTIFYTASDFIGGDQMTGIVAKWQFSNLAAKLECMKCVEILANQAFASLVDLKDENGNWLESDAIDAAIEQAAHEEGCHIDLNKAQYAMMRRLRAVEKTTAGMWKQVAGH
jgi:hypothetical protein